MAKKVFTCVFKYNNKVLCHCNEVFFGIWVVVFIFLVLYEVGSSILRATKYFLFRPAEPQPSIDRFLNFFGLADSTPKEKI